MSTRSHLWRALLPSRGLGRAYWFGLLRPPSVRQRHWPARWASWVKGDASLLVDAEKNERGGLNSRFRLITNPSRRPAQLRCRLYPDVPTSSALLGRRGA